MISFFSKKEYLSNIMVDMIDIHNHILPGIDDGAKSVSDSIILLKSFKELGVSEFVFTPHIMGDYYPNNPTTIRGSYRNLLDELSRHSDLSNLSVSTAAEHMIDVQFENVLDEHEEMPIKKEYLLVETSFLQAAINFNPAIEQIKNKGYHPILAHPERYNYIRDVAQYQKIKDSGVYFQLNLLSIAGYYGKDVYGKAEKLILEGLIDFIGTDVHNMQHLNYLKNAKVPEKILEKLKPIVDRNRYHFGNNS